MAKKRKRGNNDDKFCLKNKNSIELPGNKNLQDGRRATRNKTFKVFASLKGGQRLLKLNFVKLVIHSYKFKGHHIRETSFYFNGYLFC